MRVMTFDPTEGVEVLPDGTVVPSTNPNELSYFLRADGPTGQLFLTVKRGHVVADITGSDPASLRYDQRTERHHYEDLDRTFLGSGTCDVVGREGESVALPKQSPGSEWFAPKTLVPVTVLFVYTPQLIARSGMTVADIEIQAEAAVNQINAAFDSSGEASYVYLLKAGAVFPSTIDEQTEAQQPNAGFRKAAYRNLIRNDGPILGARGAAGADIVVALMSDNGNANAPSYGSALLQRRFCNENRVFRKSSG